jgi:hypothetical protein
MTGPTWPVRASTSLPVAAPQARAAASSPAVTIRGPVFYRSPPAGSARSRAGARSGRARCGFRHAFQCVLGGSMRRAEVTDVRSEGAQRRLLPETGGTAEAGDRAA